jgi:predicted nucleic-acid-binding protein
VIGVDTNILVRFLVQDDPRQSEAARSLFARCSVREPAFIGREALIETVWVLESAYGLPPSRVAPVILGLLEAEEIVVEAAEDAVVAVEAYGAGLADFADHMIVRAARRTGCSTLYTFDRKAARNNGATLLVR